METHQLGIRERKERDGDTGGAQWQTWERESTAAGLRSVRFASLAGRQGTSNLLQTGLGESEKIECCVSADRDFSN